MTLSLSTLPPAEKASTLCQCIYKTFISEQDPKGFILFPTVYIFRYCVGYMGFPSVLLLKNQKHSPLWYADWKIMQSWPKLQVDLWPFPTDGKTQTKWMQWNQLLPKDSAFLSPLNPFLLSGCQSLWIFFFPSWTATEWSRCACFFLTSEVPRQDLPQAVCCASAVTVLSKEKFFIAVSIRDQSTAIFHLKNQHSGMIPFLGLSQTGSTSC